MAYLKTRMNIRLSASFYQYYLMVIHQAMRAVVLSMVALINISLSASEQIAKTNDEDLQQLHSALWQLKKEANYSRKGADTCLKCHDNSGNVPVLDIFQGKHGNPNIKNSPFQHYQCETCHGPIGEHDKKRLAEGESRETMFVFGKHSQLQPEEQNQICLSCHQEQQNHWQQGQHQQANLTCVSCHQIHSSQDPMQQAQSQIMQCSTCHQQQWQQSQLASAHALGKGLMACNDCHSQHQKFSTPTLELVNKTCFQCHADKKGPFVWPHQPASENCTSCHAPHGSNHKPMLTQQPPFLCQQCHGGVSHAGVIPDKGANATEDSSAMFLFNRGCVNCHSQIHGSNHPSGSGLQR